RNLLQDGVCRLPPAWRTPSASCPAPPQAAAPQPMSPGVLGGSTALPARELVSVGEGGHPCARHSPFPPASAARGRRSMTGPAPTRPPAHLTGRTRQP